MKNYKYLIIDGGMTADVAVHGVRERDNTGTIAVLCGEKHPPYDAGTGIEPEVGLAKSLGLKIDNGIVVDETLRAAPDIYAAGDVANVYSPALGVRRRVEHEDNANTMGAMAGRNMAGASEKYEHLPNFYSDLFDLGYEAVGEFGAGLDIVEDWKEPFRQGVVYYLKAGRVRGVLLWNTWGQVDAARRLITSRDTISAAALAGLIRE